MVDTLSVEISVNGEQTRFDLPAGLVDRLSEPGDSRATVVADIAVMAFTGRAHALAHHGEGDADQAVADIEADMLDRFEDRFGLTYAEATGHSH